MRHRRCRRVVPLSIHGFSLRASPAVTHGASPLGTVDAYREALFPQSFPHGFTPQASSPGTVGECDKNTIRALADAIRLSADSLIVFANAIRKFTLVRIVQCSVLKKVDSSVC